jgi:hypothetical protein
MCCGSVREAKSELNVSKKLHSGEAEVSGEVVVSSDYAGAAFALEVAGRNGTWDTSLDNRPN